MHGSQSLVSYVPDYTGCPQKAERSIFFIVIFENIAYFDFIR